MPPRSPASKVPSLLHIPLIRIKDKQAFGKDMLSLMGKAVDVAKTLKDEGARLIHVIDTDALAGLTNNLDIYDNLTYFVNVQVECAPIDKVVKKLLSLKCRVVLEPGKLDLSNIREKKLLVAKVPRDYALPLPDFNDVIVENADDDAVKRFLAMGKRVIVYETDYRKLETWNRKLIWGVIEPAISVS